MIKSPSELLTDIAARAKARRLGLRLTQAGLASRSGVSLGTLKLFERTGKISLESLLKLSVALGSSDAFEGVFAPPLNAENLSLDALMKTPKTRKRGSRA